MRGKPRSRGPSARKSKVLWPQPIFSPIGQGSKRPQEPCQANRLARSPNSHCTAKSATRQRAAELGGRSRWLKAFHYLLCYSRPVNGGAGAKFHARGTICNFVGSIAKRRAYGRSGLATSAILLAPKKNQQNYNWQRYTQQPKQCAASQSHCFSPSCLMYRGKRLRWILSSPRAKKFFWMIPRGPQAQGARIEPGQTYLWKRRRNERGGAEDAALAGSPGQRIEGLMASTYIRPSTTKINRIITTSPRPPPP